jgi:hypothetical protein
MSDEQDQAEALDEDELRIDDDAFDDDPAHDLNDPPMRAMGVHEYGITAAEEEFDEPLEERVRRETPDPLVEELEREEEEDELDAEIDAVLDEES